ncbi:MAG: hypothetical protein NUV51_11660 [Sulfuricaulis sp.]|nr:hypothetical protein [Sulfuricaulis sp.]
MIILGLAGHAGSGKDTVADYLVDRYGFVKFSFTDSLYREVAEAFGLESTDLLRNRATKEVPHDFLALEFCTDDTFTNLALSFANQDITQPNSPRQILQWWGTEYKRAQDPRYWIEQTESWIDRMMTFGPYPELRRQLFVNTSVRFESEREWIHSFAPFANVWHIHRDAAAPVASHESETPLPVLEGEREIWNNYTLEYLHMGIDQLMSSNIPSIRIEPPEPMVKPQ